MNMYELIMLLIGSFALFGIFGLFFRVGFNQKKLGELIENKFEKLERKFEEKFEKIDIKFGLVDKNYQQLITRVAILESKFST